MNKEKISIKEIVRKKYNDIALQSKAMNQSSCCGATSCCSEPDYTIFSDDYSDQSGYAPDADLGLGCGIPTEFASIRPGDTVLDLGSGAGNDAFVARSLVGEAGKVIGVDFATAMINQARQNAGKLGFENVEFIWGDIENLPLEANSIDVVISNCVLNLLPDKNRAFAEMFRVLKPKGRFCVSDVVIQGELPDALQQDAEMYAGCVSGAIQRSKYLYGLERAGFSQIEVMKEKTIHIPDDILGRYMSNDELISFRSGKTGIFSVTVFGTKA